MRVAWIALAAVLLCTLSAAQRAISTGSDLLAECQPAVNSLNGVPISSQGAGDFEFCDGWITATNGFFTGPLAGNLAVCIPSSVTIPQEIRVLVKALADNPRELNEDASSLTYHAFLSAWPCRKP